MTSIAVSSQKGGVGKTTLSINLAHAFARAGVNTLLVDAEGWEGEKLQELKSGAQDMVRTAKADLKRMEKEMKGCAAQRKLDRRAATLSKLQRETAEAQ